MNYLESGKYYKVVKFIRYVRMYGLARTLVKVKSYYHFISTKRLIKYPEPIGGNIAIIGCGKYSFAVIAFYLRKNGRNLIRYCYDTEELRSISLANKYKATPTNKLEDILNDKKVELVFIASNHASHADYAVRCIEAGKSVHIEKPHVVNVAQYDRLNEALRLSPVYVNLGYNRPKAELSKKVFEILDKYEGPISASWFVSGHEIEKDHWYFDEKEGGRVLGNLCHWLDYSYQLLKLNSVSRIDILPTINGVDKENCITTLRSDKGDLITINFSAKGHTFEGVGEVLSFHRGDCVGNLVNYRTLEVSDGLKAYKINRLRRDHGHRANIEHSLHMMKSKLSTSLFELDVAGKLLLLTKQAIDENSLKSLQLR